MPVAKLKRLAASLSLALLPWHSGAEEQIQRAPEPSPQQRPQESGETRAVPSAPTLRTRPEPEIERHPEAPVQPPLPQVETPALPSTPAAAAKPPASTAPDERILWRLYRQSRWSALRGRIAAWRREFPGWRPPRDLLTAMADTERQTRLQNAVRRGEWRRLAGFAQHDRRLLSCQRPDVAWLVAEGRARAGNADASETIFRGLLPCRASIQLPTLQKASAALPPDRADRLWRAAEPLPRSAADQDAFDRALYDFGAGQIVRAHERKDSAALTGWAERFGPRIAARKDAGIAALLGWHGLEDAQPQTAERWFRVVLDTQPDSADARYGLALALKAQGHHAELDELLKSGKATDPRLQNLAAANALDQGWAAYRRGDYTAAQRWSAQAAQQGVDTQDAELLKAWLAYRSGDRHAAAEIFERLYRAKPTPDTAQGLAQSLRESDPGRLRRLVGELDGPLALAGTDEASTMAYARKHFLTAGDLGRTRYPALAHIDSSAVALGTLFRHKSGQRGLGRLDLWHRGVLEANWTGSGYQRWGFRVSDLELNAGRPQVGALLGSGPVRADLGDAYTHRLDGGLGAELTWFKEGTVAPYASLGFSPLNGAVGPLPVFRAGAVDHSGRGPRWIEAYSQPIRQSILSYTGLRDPVTGMRWGRVHQTGLTVGASFPLVGAWGYWGSLDAGYLHGQNVADNWTLSISQSIGYDFRFRGFDYFTLGPYMSYQHFDRDLSHFTLGHGGYFSPEHYVNGGLSANFLTAEGRSFVIRGRISVGVQAFDQSASRWFPRQADTVSNPVYAANRQVSEAFDFELKGVYQASPHWQLIGGITARRTSGFEDYGAGFFVRYLLDPRPAAFSTDIPGSLFTSVY